MKGLRWFLFFFLAVGLLGSWTSSHPFLTGDGVGVDAGVTKVNGTDFTSEEVSIRRSFNVIGLTVIFERVAGSSSTVDFTFEVSYDEGTSWATFEGVTLSIRTDHSVVTGNFVRVFMLVNVPAVSDVRLKSIKNNDGANNLTKCNVVLSK